MCGQCAEEAYVTDILTEAPGIEMDLERELYNIYYLQETDSLAKSLNKIEKAVRTEGPEKDLLKFLDAQVILCRLLELLIENGFDSQEYTTCLKSKLVHQVIASECGKQRKSIEVLERISFLSEEEYPLNQELLDSSFDIAGHPFPITPFSALYKTSTYLNQEEWLEFISREELTDHCQEVLSFYIDWWLKGNELRKNDLNQVMKEIGVYDAIMEITNDERLFFDTVFRIIFFSLVLLTKKAKGMDYVKEVVLTRPSGASFFDALDLWLQRKAAYNLFVKSGPAFFSSHRGEIRPALLDYLVLKFKLPPFPPTS